jgi:uncharacterized protein YraI
MNFWKQLPNATKIYLVILAYLVFLLCGLVIFHQVRGPEGFSLSKLIPGRSKALALTQTAQTTLVQPSPTIPPGAAWLRSKTNAQVFEGPGGEYPSIAWLENDQIAEIVGVSEDQKWWAIQLPYFSQGKGWVSAEQVEVNNIANVPVLGANGESLAAGPTPASIPKVKAVTNINIRAGPDLRYQKLGTLEAEQSADIVGVSADQYWYLIKVPGTSNVQGWVSKDYVTTQDADNVPIIGAESNTQTTLAPGSAYLIAKATLNVRGGPDITFGVVGQLTQGQMAEIIGKTEDGIWLAIRMNGTDNSQGWVAAAYVEAQNLENVPVLK